MFRRDPLKKMMQAERRLAKPASLK